MKTFFSRYALTLCLVSVLLTSCKKEDGPTNPDADITFMSQNFTVTNGTPYSHAFVSGGASIQGQVNTNHPPQPYFYLSGGAFMAHATGNETRFFNAGDVISGSTTTWASGPSTMSNADFGQGIKYVGFYFNNNGAIHYGWMKLNFTVSDTFVIVEYAYNNTAGESIDVGQK